MLQQPPFRLNNGNINTICAWELLYQDVNTHINKNVSSEKNQSRETMDMTEDDASIYVTAIAAKTSKNILEGSHKEGEKGNDEVKKILELELKVRQMERELKEKDAKLRQVAAVEQERIEML
jgi:hypothetical protein